MTSFAAPSKSALPESHCIPGDLSVTVVWIVYFLAKQRAARFGRYAKHLLPASQPENRHRDLQTRSRATVGASLITNILVPDLPNLARISYTSEKPQGDIGNS